MSPRGAERTVYGMTKETESPRTIRSTFRRVARSGRVAMTTVVVSIAAAAAVLLGGGVASAANSFPVVVGMTTDDAYAALDRAGVDYETVMTIGDGGTCTITQQFNLGSTDGSWDGLGLWQNCA